MSNYSTTRNNSVLNRLSGTTRTVNRDDILKLPGIWAARFTQRRQLAKLPTHLLDDIGISAAEAAEEASKPFWMA